MHDKTARRIQQICPNCKKSKMIQPAKPDEPHRARITVSNADMNGGNLTREQFNTLIRVGSERTGTEKKIQSALPNCDGRPTSSGSGKCSTEASGT
jgi:hypothetical protein